MEQRRGGSGQVVSLREAGGALKGIARTEVCEETSNVYTID